MASAQIAVVYLLAAVDSIHLWSLFTSEYNDKKSHQSVLSQNGTIYSAPKEIFLCFTKTPHFFLHELSSMFHWNPPSIWACLFLLLLVNFSCTLSKWLWQIHRPLTHLEQHPKTFQAAVIDSIRESFDTRKMLVSSLIQFGQNPCPLILIHKEQKGLDAFYHFN